MFLTKTVYFRVIFLRVFYELQLVFIDFQYNLVAKITSSLSVFYLIAAGCSSKIFKIEKRTANLKKKIDFSPQMYFSYKN